MKDNQKYILESILKKFEQINKVDLVSFCVFVGFLFLVFLYNSIYMIIGNHDLHLIYNSIRPDENLYIGRFSATWLEYILCFKQHIPLLTNTISFIFISLGILLFLNYYDFPKKLHNYILLGLFFILTPYIYFIFYYKILTLSFSYLIFFSIISILLTDKIPTLDTNRKKILYFLISTIIMTVLVLGTYQPIICLVLFLPIGKILTEYIDSSDKNLYEIIKDKKYTFLMIITSILLEFITYYFLKKYNFMVQSEINTTLINISDLLKQSIFFIKNTFFFPFTITYPYIGKSINICFAIINLLGFTSIITHVIKQKQTKCKIAITLYFLGLFLSQIIFLISPTLYNDPIYRLQYWSTVSFAFWNLILCFKYAKVTIKNILFLLLIYFYVHSTCILFLIQKNQIQANEIELDFNKKINQEIIKNKNFEKSKQYTILFAGNYPSFKKRIYKYNKYNKQSELLFELAAHNNYHETLIYISNEENEIQYKNPQTMNRGGRFLNPPEIINYIAQNTSNKTKYEILNINEAFPFEESICIDNENNLIIVFINKEDLEYIKQMIK